MFREFFVGFLSNLLGLTFLSTEGMKKEKQDKLDNILTSRQRPIRQTKENHSTMKWLHKPAITNPFSQINFLAKYLSWHTTNCKQNFIQIPKPSSVIELS